MKTIFLFWMVALVAFARPATAQSTFPKPVARNAVYAELLGMAGLYSLNYERLLSKEKSTMPRLRIGLSVWPYFQGITPGVYKYWGKNKHHVEAGIGVLVARQERGQLMDASWRAPVIIRPYVTPQLGYRYQKPTGGFLFRATFTPWIGFDFEETKLKPWIGFSFGKAF